MTEGLAREIKNMSDRLTVSATFSVLMMAAYALLGAAG
jgi:hypothetical protein